MKKQTGFTLIELIIVIVILGILAAYAVPKYMDIDKEARKSVVKGLEGSVRTAADLVHAIAIAKDLAPGVNAVNIGSGNEVAIGGSKYPTATNEGIREALADTYGFTITPGTNSISFTKNGATNQNTCIVTYSYSGGNNDVPDFYLNQDGC